MSMVKVIELLAQSEESWEDATRQAVERASQTMRNIQSVWVSEFEAVVDDNEVTQFRVNVKISSFSKISQASGSPLSSHAEARQWAFSLLAGVFCSGGAPGATVVETADRKRSAPDRGEHRQAAGAAAAEELRAEQQEAAPAQGATTGAAKASTEKPYPPT